MSGPRVAILGLGRTGLALAKATLSQGMAPTLFDRANREEVVKRDALEAVEALGVEVRLGWNRGSGGFEVGEPETDYGLDPEKFELVIPNPAIDHRSRILRGAVADGIEVIGEVEFAYRIAKAPIVAITGTNGKSTTTVMTYLCLRACDEDAILCGNIFGSGYPEMTLVEAACAARSDQVLVAEISSFQLEWVSQFAPVSAAITNITPDHLNRYDSFDQYAATKQRIHAAQAVQHFAVDLGFAIGPATRIEPEPLPFAFPVSHDNANGAAALSLIEGYRRYRGKPHDRGLALRALREFKGLSHRMEWVGERRGAFVLNNSMCTNAAAVLSSVESVRAERRHVLLGGINKGLDFSELRQLLADSKNLLYLYGESKDELNSALGGGHPVYPRMREATESALKSARSGDVVILSPGCASMDEFEDFRQRGDVFKAIAKEWLNR